MSNSVLERYGRSMVPARSPLTEEAALRLVVAGTVSETGTAFFHALVKNLAAAMGTAGAWVTEFVPEQRRLRALAFWLNGEFLDAYEQPIDGTPCEAVLDSRRLLHIPEGLERLYPDDPDVRALKVESYLGVPLLDSDSTVLGHLAVLDTKPLPADSRLVPLFEIFAARASAEQRRLRVEQQVRTREEQLSALLESAMDAIIVLDGAMVVSRVNPAAERLFGCTAEDLVGENLRDFLPPESATRLDAFVHELDSRPAGPRQLWIPQSFTVQRWDRSAFPADATLSRFENRGQVFHTLILRNVDERLAAARRIENLTVQTEFLRAEIRALHHFDEILGQSQSLRRVLAEVEQVAVTDAAVLLQGETGTGKELFARAIHAASRRREQPLVTVNCAAIPASLIESEFFGHEKGAFTGATSRREGRFALADGGTLFLDEAGELPLELQGKLLRVLQEGTFEPVGGSTTRRVNVRVVAATNRDLAREVKEGRFRQDLFFRLNVFPLQLPPLRERPEDIPALAEAFLKRFTQPLGRTWMPLTPDDLHRLQSYAWPGNVRELQNVIERAVITAVNGRLNLDRALPEPDVASDTALQVAKLPVITNTVTVVTPGAVRTLEEMVAFERQNLVRALQSTQWRVSGENGAAALLAMNPSTLRSRMKALNIRPPL